MQAQEDPRYEAGLAAGRREAVEQLVAELRRKAASWRAGEAKRGAIRSALLWSFTEAWLARVEGVAAELEAQVPQLRTFELAALAAPVILPPPAPPLPKRTPAKPKGRAR